MFEAIVLRNRNTFETFGVVTSQQECEGDHCVENSVGIMKFTVNLVYEDLVDSDPIYVSFNIEHPGKDYQLHYLSTTTAKFTHFEYEAHPHKTHVVTVDNTDIDFEVDLGAVQAETDLEIEISIQYSKDSDEPEPRFIEYEFYVGFAEDRTNTGLVDTIYKRDDKVSLYSSID